MQRVKLLPVNFGFCCRTRQMCWIVTRGCCTDSRDEAGSEWNNHRICNCPILLSSVWAAWHASHQAMLPSNFGILWLDSFVIQKKLEKEERKGKKRKTMKEKKREGTSQTSTGTNLHGEISQTDYQEQPKVWEVTFPRSCLKERSQVSSVQSSTLKSSLRSLPTARTVKRNAMSLDIESVQNLTLLTNALVAKI